MTDNTHVKISVIIPTHGRSTKLGACVSALAAQTYPDFEVLIGCDGPDDAAAAVARDTWLSAGRNKDRLRVEQVSKRGQAAVRNALLPFATGDLLVFLNDDMRPAPGHLNQHATAHAMRPANAAPALVIGDSPWVSHEPDMLLQRLIRETSMIFFYNVMQERIRSGAVRADHDWGFRHAWLLNLSVPARIVCDCGGFTVFPSTYGYEDDELAHRCRDRFGSPVIYEPGAVAHHDHLIDSTAYLVREYNLGYAAIGFARTTPGCARELFGRDVQSEPELSYSREHVQRELAAARRVWDVFRTFDSIPAAAADPQLMPALYQQHLPLKRWVWRRGLLDAATGQPMDSGRTLADLAH